MKSTQPNLKENFILDLDQTLISAEAEEEYDFKKYNKKAKLFNFQDMDGYYIVFERPGLQKFLDYLFSHYNVSVWTAATKDYALFIIEKMLLKKKKNRTLDYIFFSYHCDISKRKRKVRRICLCYGMFINYPVIISQIRLSWMITVRFLKHNQ